MLNLLMFIIGKITFFTGSLINNASFLKPLEKEEEKELIKKAKEGDKKAKEKLINHNMRLVAHIAKKYSNAYETDDLLSVGSIGLIKAINTFEEEKGTQLATYMARCIENEILMLLRSAKKYKNEISLNSSVGKDKEGNELTLINLLTDSEDSVYLSVDKEIERVKFDKFLKETLSDREYKIICLRYAIKSDRAYCQREVAKILKISRSYISRIETQAIEKLRYKVKKGQFYC